MNKIDKLKKLLLFREAKIRAARVNFWTFCTLITPMFYTEEKTYLKELCDTLQKVYERKLVNEKGEAYRKILLSIPPRHGKTLTKDHFILWVLGQEPHRTKIMSASYSHDLSIESSRFIRNTIEAEKNNDLDVNYHDIFPSTTLSDDNANVNKWSLKGSFFTYKATSKGGAATGMGTNFAVIDDLVKDSLEAFNEAALEKTWSWFTDTFLSREEGEEGLFIVIGTRWAKKDIIGKILESEYKDDWLEIKLQAFDKEENKMLCESILSKRQYDYLSNTIQRNIFLANYQQEPFDEQGRLYKTILSYETEPKQFDKIIGYIDTADTGTDYLCYIAGGVLNGEIYILESYYTQDDMTITEKELPRLFDSLQKKYNTPVHIMIEGNNGGSYFARTLEKTMKTEYKNSKVIIKYFTQRTKKESRILSYSSFIQSRVYFPKNFPNKHKVLYNHLVSFQADFKSNKHDDAADTLTGLCEMVEQKNTVTLGRGLFD